LHRQRHCVIKMLLTAKS